MLYISKENGDTYIVYKEVNYLHGISSQWLQREELSVVILVRGQQRDVPSPSLQLTTNKRNTDRERESTILSVSSYLHITLCPL
uniref:Uncharacterized protein n=1 Tax=Arion vulgaris TaxID=1028688 RepID=A0A0B7A641_9EUPU